MFCLFISIANWPFHLSNLPIFAPKLINLKHSKFVHITPDSIKSSRIICDVKSHKTLTRKRRKGWGVV